MIELRRRWQIGVVVGVTALLAPALVLPGPIVDCNGNGVADDEDISAGTSQDCDGNGNPDECDTELSFLVHSIAGPADRTLSRIGAADLDDDGNPDVVYATPGDDFGEFAQAYWRANPAGDGSLGPETPLQSFVGAPFALVDLDGDEYRDFVGCDSVTNLVSWFENLDGQGFGAQQIIHAGDDHAALVSADLDGDGDGDLLAAATTDPDRLHWLENRIDTDGEFAAIPNQVSASIVDPADVIALTLELVGTSRGDDVTLEKLVMEKETTFYVPVKARPEMVRIDPQLTLLAEIKEVKSRDWWKTQLLSAPSVAERLRAVEHFGNSKNNADRELLKGVLDSDRFYGVQLEAATALGNSGGEISRDGAF